MRTPATLTAATFDVLWTNRQLGLHHPTLSVPALLRNQEQQRAYLDHAFADLDRVGLLTRGQPNPDLIDALHLIAAPRHEFYGWITTGPEDQKAVLVAAASLDPEGDAIMAVHDGDTVTLRPLRADTATRALTRHLPDTPAGRGRTITLAETDLGPDGKPATANTSSESEEPAAYMSPVQPATTPADRLSRLLHEPRIGAGQLYTATRNHRGQRNRNPVPIAYIDTRHHGRWLTTTEPNTDGQSWIIATPVTRGQLADRLAAAHSKLHT